MRPQTWRSARVIFSSRAHHQHLMCGGCVRQAVRSITQVYAITSLSRAFRLPCRLRFLQRATFTGRQDLRRSECPHASKTLLQLVYKYAASGIRFLSIHQAVHGWLRAVLLRLLRLPRLLSALLTLFKRVSCSPFFALSEHTATRRVAA